MENKIKMLSRKEYPLVYDDESGNFPYGYFIGDKLAGMIKVTHTDNDDFYGLSEFIVYEEYRNKGIGTKLLQYVIGKYGKYDLILNVYKENYKAIRLYKKFGFKITYTNDNPDQGDKFYVMTRRGNSVKGGLNMGSNKSINSCLVQSDAIGINAGGLDGIAVIVTYNIIGAEYPMARDEIINIIGADTILNDIHAEYKRNGKKMPDVTMDGVDSYFAPDGNRIIAEFTLDDYFDYE